MNIFHVINFHCQMFIYYKHYSIQFMHFNKRYIFFIYLKQSSFARILHYLQKFVLIPYTVDCCWKLDRNTWFKMFSDQANVFFSFLMDDIRTKNINIIFYKLKLNLNMQNKIPVQCSQTSHGHPYYKEMVSA